MPATNASAALNIGSRPTSALLPRLALASAIASPATGLVGSQTSGTPGYYDNAAPAGRLACVACRVSRTNVLQITNVNCSTAVLRSTVSLNAATNNVDPTVPLMSVANGAAANTFQVFSTVTFRVSNFTGTATVGFFAFSAFTPKA